MVVDPAYGVDDFNKPKVLSEMETYVNSILLVLVTVPGQYPSLPKFGMNIREKLYQFEDEINVNKIKAELVYQCSEFLPSIETGELDVVLARYQEKPMLVFYLPTIDDSSHKVLVLGVSINKYGELVYNFVEGNKTQVI